APLSKRAVRPYSYPAATPRFGRRRYRRIRGRVTPRLCRVPNTALNMQYAPTPFHYSYETRFTTAPMPPHKQSMIPNTAPMARATDG
ncbi:hypothetical protein, partial [Acetobacter orientalis]|uniref:hypothetical protein n=1 Tax=Acetobacter orientalis TaxID=146474 RepID=UPI0039E75EFE